MYVFHELSPNCAEFRHPELLSEESLSWKQKKKKVRGLPALQCLGRVQVAARQTDGLHERERGQMFLPQVSAVRPPKTIR